MISPKVIARGTDYLAEKIKEIGKKYDVPIVENPPLARSIYKMVKVGPLDSPNAL